MIWRNHYQGRAKFATASTWPSREAAEQRAAALLDTLSRERSAWAQSVRYLGAVEEKA